MTHNAENEVERLIAREKALHAEGCDYPDEDCTCQQARECEHP